MLLLRCFRASPHASGPCRSRDKTLGTERTTRRRFRGAGAPFGLKRRGPAYLPASLRSLATEGPAPSLEDPTTPRRCVRQAPASMTGSGPRNPAHRRRGRERRRRDARARDATRRGSRSRSRRDLAQRHPPVCKIMDFGKFKYETQKKEAEARKKQKIIEIKEVKFRPNTDVARLRGEDAQRGALPRRRRQGEGDAALPGPRDGAPGPGRNLLERVAEDVKEIGKVENMPRIEGRQMVMMIGPAK
jgi:translation initiation factor IF-3